MKFENEKLHRSHGDGLFNTGQFKHIGNNVILEDGVLVFHPENIILHSNIYVGHNTILKGYYKNEMIIGAGTWIGQNSFLHSAGGIEIGRAVGIGPSVKIMTSNHVIDNLNRPVLYNPIELKKVILQDGCDIGIGSIVLPGVAIGQGAIVGAGSIVTKDVPDFAVAAGSPARILRFRNDK